ncbi:AhpD-like protein [Hypoxylon fuscum]|nr:AhpD-like protein [Hypoxylon fuscum]
MAPKTYDDPYRHTCLVPYVDANTAPPQIAKMIKVHDFRRNIFLTLAHSQGLFPNVMGVIGGCFRGETRTVPLLDWQLIVLRVATKVGAKYMYDVNLPVCEIYEMPQDKIDAIGCSPESVLKGEGPWTERDRLILRVVDEQLATMTNKEETIEEALKVLSNEEMVEVLIIIGAYCMLARIIRGLKVDDDQPIRPPGLTEALKASVTPDQPK